MLANEPEQSDFHLVRRVQAGETEAFDEIDRRYRSPLCRFLARFASGRDQAEEFAQQTLIRAFEKIGQLRSGDKLGGWLYRIAFHVAAAEGRRRKPVPLEETELQVPADLLPDTLHEEEMRQTIWETARRELSPEEYRVLEMRYREDLALPEIAAKLKKKEGAVRVQLHRARRKLLPFLSELQDSFDKDI